MSLRLPGELLQQIEAVHKRYSPPALPFAGLSRADVVRIAIEEGLKVFDQRMRRDVSAALPQIEKILADRLKAEKLKGGAQ